MPTTKQPESSTRRTTTASRSNGRRPNGKIAQEAAALTYRGEALMRDFEDTVATNPVRSALIALGVGFVLGRMWR